jgi:sugar lactone lactonase YvrE
VVELPVSQVTCCAFGGAGLDTLFITTATQRMSPEARAAEPLAGGLFAVNVGVKGIADTRFAG